MSKHTQREQRITKLMHKEREAWKTMCDALQPKLHIQDVNDPVHSPLINAIKLWGIRLMVLRIIQRG